MRGVRVQRDDCLSTGEVAAECGVSPSMVRKWEAAGRLSSVRTIGGHRRFEAEDVEALRRERASASDARQADRSNP